MRAVNTGTTCQLSSTTSPDSKAYQAAIPLCSSLILSNKGALNCISYVVNLSCMCTTELSMGIVPKSHVADYY